MFNKALRYWIRVYTMFYIVHFSCFLLEIKSLGEKKQEQMCGEETELLSLHILQNKSVALNI